LFLSQAAVITNKFQGLTSEFKEDFEQYSPAVQEQIAGLLQKFQAEAESLKKYNVISYIVSSDNEFYKAIEQVGLKRPIKFLVVGGHGGFDEFKKTSDKSIHFSDSTAETGILNNQDIQKMLDLNLDSYLSDNSDILLQSCYAADEDTTLGVSFAKELLKVFTRSAIYGPSSGTFGSLLEFSGAENSIPRLTDIVFYMADTHKYLVSN
jgi:hypothetical protein